MPLKVLCEDDGDRPAIICDHCGREIADAAAGNCQWVHGPDKAVTPYFTHKRCCLAFEDANRHLGQWNTNELACLPVQLVFGLRVKWGRAVKLTKWLSSIGR